MKHEENVNLKRVSKIAKIDARMKVIQIPKTQHVGIKTWGRIDYLCNVHGYRIVSSGIIIGDVFTDDNKTHNREVKKQLKAAKAEKNMAKKNHKKK